MGRGSRRVPVLSRCSSSESERLRTWVECERDDLAELVRVEGSGSVSAGS